VVTYLINQAILIAFNFLNVWLDAYKIKKALKQNVPKAVRHGVNLGAYAICVGLIIWLFKLQVWDAVLFGVSAFFNRQLSFDIPLNKRRGLPWDYVSPAKPPDAIMDRIEIRLFGYNGKAPVFCYSLLWVGCLIVKFFL
jgi:hypothetical protein